MQKTGHRCHTVRLLWRTSTTITIRENLHHDTDGIEVNPADMTLKFTGSKANSVHEEEITTGFLSTIPSLAWDRLKALRLIKSKS